MANEVLLRLSISPIMQIDESEATTVENIFLNCLESIKWDCVRDSDLRIIHADKAGAKLMSFDEHLAIGVACLRWRCQRGQRYL